MTRPWVVTLFAPPVLRVTAPEHRRLQREARLRAQLPPLYRLTLVRRSRLPLTTRLRACRRQWAEVGGWRPYKRWRRFVWDDADGLRLSPCLSCRHKLPQGAVCLAFPEGIPDDILMSRHDHRTPYPGDRGITYEEVPDDHPGL